MSDENQNQVLPNDGSPPGHIEKMLGRKPAETPAPIEGEGTVAQRPENVPEKFWDAAKGVINTEALLKAQADAEAALRRSQAPAGDNEELAGGQEVTKAQAPVVETASKEWAEKGELSEDTFKALEGVGLSRDMVNMYIAGQQAIVSNLQSAAYGPFEGKDGYEAAANWAAENLSEAEIKALDVQLTSTTPEIVAQGAKSLLKVYSDNAEIEPQAIRGNSNGFTAGDTYGSRAEMMKDMASPQYRTSEAFRTAVREKLRRSKL